MWTLAAQIFLPSWSGFVLGVSRLGSEDTLGLPDFEVGRWVDITCDTGSIEIEQGYQQPHPLSMYTTGTATLTLHGYQWAPSVNPDMLPGCKLRVFAQILELVPEFTNQYFKDFLTEAVKGVTTFSIFEGYIDDLEEIYTKDDTPNSVNIHASDEWIRVVRLGGDTGQEKKNIAFNTLPTHLTEWGVNTVIYGSLATTVISQLEQTQQSVERAMLSTMGTAWVNGNAVYISDSDIWASQSPTVAISDVHSGPHLCYMDFDKRNKLSVMNSISQTNTAYVYNAVLNKDELVSATKEFVDVPSKVLYGDSGHTVSTSLQTNNWDGNGYLSAGRYPDPRTRSVEVLLTPDTIDLLPNIHETVSFTYRGTTEERRVCSRRITLTPKSWKADIDFFDFLLFEVNTPYEENHGLQRVSK